MKKAIFEDEGMAAILSNARVLVNEETSLKAKLKQIGVRPKTLISYLKEKIAEDRAMLEVKKDLMPKIEYYKMSLDVNEMEVFLISLENSL